MSKNRSGRVSKGAAALVIGLTLVVAVAIVMLMLPKNDTKPNSGETVATTEPNRETTGNAENTGNAETTAPTVVIQQYAETTSERWVAAGMALAVSLEYPGVEQMEFYLASETPIADRMSGKGVYAKLIVEGQELLLYSAPIEAERSESGTRDLFVPAVGFNTLEEITPANSVDLSAMEKVTVEDLRELIGQATLTSVYSH